MLDCCRRLAGGHGRLDRRDRKLTPTRKIVPSLTTGRYRPDAVPRHDKDSFIALTLAETRAPRRCGHIEFGHVSAAPLRLRTGRCANRGISAAADHPFAAGSVSAISQPR